MMSILERRSTAELDERLQAELRREAPDGNLVREILRVLEEREKDYPAEITPQIQAAWDRFNDQGRTERPRPTARNWVRRTVSIAASAAILCIVLLGVIPQSVQAETWWEKLFDISDSVFQFFNSAEQNEVHADYVFKTDNPGLQEVYDAVVELGVTEPVVPMWLPEGYELVECTTRDSRARKSVCAVFAAPDEKLVYELKFYDNNVWHEYQKDESAIVEYEKNGTVHKMMGNNDQMVAVWEKDRTECFLSTQCGEEIFYKIINSIYSSEVN